MISIKKISFLILFLAAIYATRINAQSSGSLPPIIKESFKNTNTQSPVIQKNSKNFSNNDLINAAEHRENLKTCLDGRYSALCKHSMLSDAEAAAVTKAEKRENYKTCIDGRYTTLCNHQLLSGNELTKVNAAERRENRRICLDGRYPALCNRSLLD